MHVCMYVCLVFCVSFAYDVDVGVFVPLLFCFNLIGILRAYEICLHNRLLLAIIIYVYKIVRIAAVLIIFFIMVSNGLDT